MIYIYNDQERDDDYPWEFSDASEKLHKATIFPRWLINNSCFMECRGQQCVSNVSEFRRSCYENKDNERK